MILKEIEKKIHNLNLDIISIPNLATYKENKCYLELVKDDKLLFNKYLFCDSIAKKSSITLENLKEIYTNEELDLQKHINDIIAISSDVNKTLELKSEVYKNSLVIEFLNIQLTSLNDEDFRKNVINFLDSNFNDYIKYLKDNSEIIENKLHEWHYKINYIERLLRLNFSIDIQNIFNSLKFKYQDTEVNLKELASKLVAADKKAKTPKQLTILYKDRILELYNLGLSYNKIRDNISQDLWDKGLLERTVERQIRTRGSKGVKEMVENKVHLSDIIKIIEDNADIIDVDFEDEQRFLN